MNMFLNMYLGWFVLFLWLGGVLSLNEECSTKGLLGSCQLVSRCTYAQDLIRKRQYPDTCGFAGSEPIVCCLQDQYQNPSNEPPLVNLVQGLPTASEKYLSEKKCELFYPKPDYHILVTGGVQSLAKEFPHMAIIGYGDEKDIQWGCGGSLISLNFVLTAGHCLESSDFGAAKWVRLGDLDLSTNTDDAEPQNFTIKRSIPHPEYQPPSRYNDIALIELDREVSLSQFVSPACLATKNSPTVSKMTASGWGKSDFIGESSSYLLKVDLDRVDNTQCRNSYVSIPKRMLPSGILDDRQICAGGVVGKDTCQGDSGGPLQVANPERSFTVKVHTLIGVTSFGKACGLSSTPGVYSRVAYYVPWIESIVWPNEK
ncbi:unnamed protein product [Phaedon cochleariae]|uniref:Peptidase S1 domain-containing protein n=1 Tax=Phaedon cochleariae TaxID=80249 RepID=A0A9P0DNR1_PHACE|nr:unnamed protein product [Phaedon cochleariae]